MRETAALVNVPETAMYKDRFAAPGKDDIWMARKLVGKAIAVAKSKQKLADRQLGSRVAAPNATHVLTSVDRRHRGWLAPMREGLGLTSGTGAGRRSAEARPQNPAPMQTGNGCMRAGPGATPTRVPSATLKSGSHAGPSE
jgi:hypothetical protein